MKKTVFGLLAAALMLLPGLAHAQIFVEVVGILGDPVVTVTASGSFTETVIDDDLGVGSGWSGDFAGAAFDNGAGLGSGSRAAIMSGDLAAMTSTGGLLPLSIGFDDDGAGTSDDFAFFLDDGSSFPFDGTTWTISGTSTFDLTTLGALPVGAMPTFSDLNPGVYTNTLPGGDMITLTIRQVPEPASACILGLGALAMTLRRKRN